MDGQCGAAWAINSNANALAGLFQHCSVAFLLPKALNCLSIGVGELRPDTFLVDVVAEYSKAGLAEEPSRFWVKTTNVVEKSELILLGTDLDNDGKPIAYFGRAEGRRGQDIRFGGTAFLTLSGAREQLQDRIARLPSVKAAAVVPKVR